MKDQDIVTVTNLTKYIFIGDDRMAILKNISCSIKYGDFSILYGPPASGKSIFLYSILGIEEPTFGEVYIEGKNILKMSEYERTNFRRSRIGIVYGHPLWVGSMDVIKNIEFSLHLNGYPGSVENKAQEILEMLGIGELAHCHPVELDNLQQQQISIARAIVTDPELIVADDPTRHLDLAAGHKLMQTFERLNAYNKTVIIVTGRHAFLTYGNKPMYMDKGMIKNETLQGSSSIQNSQKILHK
ncbi:MAG: hypothetical protein RI947_1108 [Candidatus Parcubacteria bacterium]|jgi:ABC-type lipoprotein export system ATPase subunit